MRYREEIKFFGTTSFLIIGVVVVAALWLLTTGISNALWAIAAALLFPLLFGRLLITITDSTLRISFGYLGVIKKEIQLSEILESRVVEYRPIRQFGGWGIRCGRFEGEKTCCYSLRGKQGLLLLLKSKKREIFVKTDRILIGCNEPEKLKASIGK